MNSDQMYEVANHLRTRFEAPHDAMRVVDYYAHTAIHALADAIQAVADSTTEGNID